MEKILLIDGHSIMNRSYYGVPALNDSKGRPTNALLGFLNILFKLLDDVRPTRLAVAFDLKEPTFRHEMYPEYKGKRHATPPELIEQIEMIKELLLAMNVKVMTLPGYEADDIIGTMSCECSKLGWNVTIVSGDRDLLQLAEEHIAVKIPTTKRGQTTVTDYYAADVKEAYGVTPEEFIDLKALMGDSSDNIGGCPGIGEKGAKTIIAKWHSIENAYANIELVEPKRAREALRNHYEETCFSKKLVTIVKNAPIDRSWLEGDASKIFTGQAYEIVKGYELKKISARFADEISHNENECVSAAETERKIFEFADESEAKEKVEKLLLSKVIGLAPVYKNESYPIGAEESIAALYISADGSNVYAAKAETLGKNAVDDLALVINRKAEMLSLFDYKRFLRALPEEAEARAEKIPVEAAFVSGNGVNVDADIIDLAVAAYIQNPTKSTYDADDVAPVTGKTIPSKVERVGKKDPDEEFIKKNPEAEEWFADTAVIACLAAEPVMKSLKDDGQYQLYSQIELPLILTLARMEEVGVYIKKDDLAEYGDDLTKKISQLESEIYELAGGIPFNINSPKQLGEILFERMGIKGGKKTKTGYSTAADVLEKLAPDYPIIGKILEYRTCAKLKSTYADGLAAFICPDGRIRSKFNQTVTATGRLSSSDPNLQNIPVRFELGKKIRKVFAAKPGCRFADADYSQIELRVLAHLSGDENLIDAYNQAQDIHAITASKVFHVPLDEVTPELRRNAKAVNFGIVYGISAFGLSNDLSISRKEALGYIDRYFETYPKLKAFLDQTVADAKEHGYTTTIAGRRRPIPELKSSNFMQRQFGERAAMNSPVQGSAADIIKIAMNRVDRRLHEELPEARLILQVHDELLIEAPDDLIERASDILREEMSGAVTLAVRLETEVCEGVNWYEAK